MIRPSGKEARFYKNLFLQLSVYRIELNLLIWNHSRQSQSSVYVIADFISTIC